MIKERIKFRSGGSGAGIVQVQGRFRLTVEYSVAMVICPELVELFMQSSPNNIWMTYKLSYQQPFSPITLD